MFCNSDKYVLTQNVIICELVEVYPLWRPEIDFNIIRKHKINLQINLTWRCRDFSAGLYVNANWDCQSHCQQSDNSNSNY